MKPDILFRANGHEIRPFAATEEGIGKIINFIATFPLAADANMSKDEIVAFILSPNNVLLESDHALIVLEEVLPGRFALVHFVFWNRKVAGNERFLYEALNSVMRMFNLKKLSAHVPDRNRAMWRLLERVGFRREGRLRREFMDRNGLEYDILAYGVMLEELNAHQSARGEIAQNEGSEIRADKVRHAESAGGDESPG
jgi:hypothetical protein